MTSQSERPMAQAGQLVEGLYGGLERLSRDEIYQRAVAADLAPEVLTYFDALPEGDYAEDELVEALNLIIAGSGDSRRIETE